MERFKLISSVHLFLIKDNKILLLLRANTGFSDGEYSVPAGHMDGGETVTAAMAREAREETGIIIRPHDLRVAHVMHRLGSDQERIDFFLTAGEWSGEPKNAEPDKCGDLSWFDLNNLPPNVVEYVGHALERYQKGEIFSEFGWV